MGEHLQSLFLDEGEDMSPIWRGISALAMAGVIAGCEGVATQPTEEQKAPDYGQKTGDQMKGMIGVPGPGGQMQKPGAPAK
jgi:hypothetical protein